MEDAQRVKVIRVVRGKAQRIGQKPSGLFGIAQLLVRQPGVVLYAGIRGVKRRCPTEMGCSFCKPVRRFGEEQAERVMYLGRIGLHAHRRVQGGFGFGSQHPRICTARRPHAIKQHGQVQVRRDEGGVDADGGPVGCRSRVGLAQVLVENGQIQVRGGLIVQGALSVAVFLQGVPPGGCRFACVVPGVSLRCELGEHAGCFHPHQPNGIGQQGLQFRDRRAIAFGIVLCSEAAYGGGPHEGRFVAECLDGGLRSTHGGIAVQQRQRRGAYDIRGSMIFHQADQFRFGLGSSFPPAGKGRGERGQAFRSMPVFDPFGSPFRGLVRMAPLAYIGRAGAGGEIGPGDLETVVPAGVYHHIGPLRHMAIDALRSFRFLRMPDVLERVVDSHIVALSAECIPLEFQPRRMRIVAIGAHNALRVHLALQERAVHVHLIAYLPIGKVQFLFEQFGLVVVQEDIARDMIRVDDPAPRVAGCTRLHLLVRRRKGCGKARRRRVVCSGLRLLHMGFPRSMACFAAHVDFRKGGLIGAGGQVEIALQVGGMAIRTHVIPVHAVARPVEPVRRGDAFVFCEREPPFTLRIPGDGECLQAPVFQRDEILLERFVTEGIGHRVGLHGSVGPLRVDKESVAFPEKARFDAAVTENGVVEVPKHGFRAGLFHGPVVIRSFPCEGSFRMAPGTDFAAHIRRGGSSAGCMFRTAPGSDKKDQTGQINQTNLVNKSACRRGFAIGKQPPDRAVSAGGPNEHTPDKGHGNGPTHEKRTRIFGGHRRFRDARQKVQYTICRVCVSSEC